MPLADKRGRAFFRWRDGNTVVTVNDEHDTPFFRERRAATLSRLRVLLQFGPSAPFS